MSGNLAEIWDISPFDIDDPQNRTQPFVFNSPHSGRHYPKSFLAQSRLDEHQIRRSEDHCVDMLFQNVSKLGAPLLKANFPRAWLDANREPYELDPKMFSGQLPSYINRNSSRVAGGLGTIPKIVAENTDIYKSSLSVEEAMARIENVYKPYHMTLTRLLRETYQNFGFSILIDCHSMPSNLSFSYNDEMPDFIIGDRYGTSADSSLTQVILELLSGLGYNVVSNKIYAGGYITQHYGRPLKHQHAIQIEINRALYMSEDTLERTTNFEHLKDDLTIFAAQLMDFGRLEFSGAKFAAQ